jgi:hypothetical protein
MSDIKSAREIALEKMEKLPKATPEELLMWRYTPEGERLGSLFLFKDINLVTEIDKFDDKVRKYIRNGASEVLARNLDLPKGEPERKNNKKAMDGLKLLKQDKVVVENILSQLRNIFKHYGEQGEQARRGAYTQLKTEFEARTRQAMSQQPGASAMNTRLDVERQPQFQEEWHKIQQQIDSQYIRLLNEFRRDLIALR